MTGKNSTEAARPGITLAEAAITALIVIFLLLAVLVPLVRRARRAGRERDASTAMKTLTTAEADFRSNDRDGNRVNDFWTGDVYALYGLIPPEPGSTTLAPDTTDATHMIKLIEPCVAQADGASRTDLYRNGPIGTGGPRRGYLFRGFEAETVSPGTHSTLLNDTDGEERFYGSCHDRNRFAFLAFPDSISSGTLVFVVNEDNTIWKFNLPESYSATCRPLGSRAESTSTTLGIGVPGLDNAGTFPYIPEPPGFRGNW